MAILQFSVTLRNARLDQFDVTLGAGPKLRIMSGTKPAACADADGAGVLLCEITLPSGYMAAAGGGVKAKSGTAWTGTGTAGAAGGTNATHFRIKNAAGSVTHCQGDITATGGGGAMTLDNVSIATGQSVTVNTFQLEDANP